MIETARDLLSMMIAYAVILAWLLVVQYMNKRDKNANK